MRDGIIWFKYLIVRCQESKMEWNENMHFDLRWSWEISLQKKFILEYKVCMIWSQGDHTFRDFFQSLHAVVQPYGFFVLPLRPNDCVLAIHLWRRKPVLVAMSSSDAGCVPNIESWCLMRTLMWKAHSSVASKLFEKNRANAWLLLPTQHSII